MLLCLSSEFLPPLFDQSFATLRGHDPAVQQGAKQQLRVPERSCAAPLQLQQRGESGGGLHEGCDRSAAQPHPRQRYATTCSGSARVFPVIDS